MKIYMLIKHCMMHMMVHFHVNTREQNGKPLLDCVCQGREEIIAEIQVKRRK